MSRFFTQTHHEDGCSSEAIYSKCETYRYALTRVWDPAGARILFVMLNPSTADARHNDPTIERCERRARQMGLGAMRVVNLFAYRATRPADLRAAPAPEGPLNREVVMDGADWADRILCAWGVHGAMMDAGPKMADLLRARGHRLEQIGLTKDGHPRHPLYVSYAVQPAEWSVTDH